jgi:galactokinase
MMGGGFGGCLLSIVKQQESQVFKDQIQAAYEKTFQLTPEFIEVALGDGARKI